MTRMSPARSGLWFVEECGPDWDWRVISTGCKSRRQAEAHVKRFYGGTLSESGIEYRAQLYVPASPPKRKRRAVRK